MDLSGSGGFEADDTIEVVPVKTAGQLLFAAPLPETLAENNAARRFAVRVRERAGEADETLSNTLMLTLGETDVPAEFAGYPTVILDVVLKAVYEGLDDPLLTVEAGAIEPGRSVRTAMALGLSTAYSDAQAEALLGSLFGVSLEASGTGGLSRSPTIAPAARALNTTNNRTSASVRCEALAPDGLCNAYRQLFDCAGDAIAGFGSGSAGGDPLARCGQIVKDEVVGAWSDYGEKIRSFGSFLRRAAPRLARGLGVGSAPAQQILDRNAAARQVIGLSKTLRAASELTEDARETYESMRDASKALTEGHPGTDRRCTARRRRRGRGRRRARSLLQPLGGSRLPPKRRRGHRGAGARLRGRRGCRGDAGRRRRGRRGQQWRRHLRCGLRGVLGGRQDLHLRVELAGGMELLRRLPPREPPEPGRRQRLPLLPRWTSSSPTAPAARTTRRCIS